MTIIPPAEQQRAAYIEGLRKLATLLHHNPRVPLPIDGKPSHVDGYGRALHIPSGVQGVAAEHLADILGRPVSAEIQGASVWLTWQISGLAVKASVPLSMCDRIVTEVVKIGDQTTEVAEYITPERFRPVEEKAQVSA